MSKTNKDLWKVASVALLFFSIALTAFFGKTLFWLAAVCMEAAILAVLFSPQVKKSRKEIVLVLSSITGFVFLGTAMDWNLGAFLKIDGMLLSVLLSFFVFLVLTATHLTFFYFLRKGNKFAIRTDLVSARKLLREGFISINEELWFRGAILLSLAVSFEPTIAIIASSVFFSLIHIKSSIHSTITALLMGLGFSIIMVLTHNILGPIIGHFLFNVVNSILIGPPKAK